MRDQAEALARREKNRTMAEQGEGSAGMAANAANGEHQARAGAAAPQIGGPAAVDLDAAWAEVRRRLEGQLGQRAFGEHIAPLHCLSFADGQVTLAAASAARQRYVAEIYGSALKVAWAAVCGGVRAVRIDVQDDPLPSALPAVVTGAPSEGEPGRDGLGYRLKAECTFDSYVVGKSNLFAYNAGRRVSELGRIDFNPLFIYGGSGVGKTHLMHAIAWEARNRRPDARIVFMSAEHFMREFIRAIRTKETPPFKDQLRSCDMLLIDDIQFIAGKESTQEEFFHTLNALIENGRQLVLTADRAPGDIENLAERVKSRLQWGLVAEIHPADYELRLAILQSKLEIMGPNLGVPPDQVPPRLLELIAQKIITNPRMLEGAMKRILGAASMTGRPVTLELVNETIPDLLRASDRKVAIDDIQKKVCEFYNLRQSEMISPRRTRSVARPRQIAMYLSKKLTTRSLPEIGRRFGGRDHSTVIHAVRKIEEERQVDAGLNEELTVLQRIIEG